MCYSAGLVITACTEIDTTYLKVCVTGVEPKVVNYNMIQVCNQGGCVPQLSLASKLNLPS